jgi:hypothetical protein
MLIGVKLHLHDFFIGSIFQKSLFCVMLLVKKKDLGGIFIFLFLRKNFLSVESKAIYLQKYEGR